MSAPLHELVRRGLLRLLPIALVAFAAIGVRPDAAAAAPCDPPIPNEIVCEGPGGPILVISNASNPFGRYYAEILRAEGLNEFTATDLSSVTAAVLNAHDVVILGETGLSAAQVQMLSDWVQSGGNLIAMRPDSQLAGLLGLTDTPDTLANSYLQVDTASGPGTGIVGQTIQYHGTADRYTTNGTQTIATLYSNASTATPNPAVTLRSVGSNGGQAAAFSYDLARSVVYTHQGNPAWAGQSRDGQSGPIRSDNLFFGNAAGDPQPDWIDFNKVAIPQADEQQRLLANLIGQMNLDRKPLPRFWFLPRDEKAAVVMTGDDHASGGTAGRFDQYKSLSPLGCSVADWECVRGTSYIYESTPLTNTQAASYEADGFEVALHVNTNCDNWTSQAHLESFYSSQLAAFGTKYTSVPPPSTNRTHCIAWSDWATQPKVELAHGIRLDTNYYYWPPGWVQDRPGMFTGSGMPMRFADLDGSMIDVYQAATQMTDESGQSYPLHANSLLDKAIGAEGYYGVFTANMHTDSPSSAGSDAIVSSAQARGVPIVTARQMLEWLDGRNGSSFDSLAWNANQLNFTIDVGAGANGLRAMVPTTSSVGSLTGVKRGGNTIATTTRTIKGVEYAFFDATPGAYEATYAVDSTAPAISNVAHSVQGNGTATITWNTDEASDSRVDNGTSPGSLTSSQSNPALVSSHSVGLTGLDPNTTYHYRVTSRDAANNSSTEPPDPGQSPRSFTTPSASFTDTLVADFSAGTPGASTYVSRTDNGEVTLNPTVGAEFSGGPGLPAEWSSQAWDVPSTGGSATVSDDRLVLNGARAGTDQTYVAGRALEFVATFSGANFQHVGFGVDFNTQPFWAMFSVKGDGSFNARTNNGGELADIPLSSSLLGSPHLYRIEWDTTEVRYFVDGVAVGTRTTSFGDTQMRPLASDLFNGDAGTVSVDWLRMSPYPSPGTFHSRVFDATQAAEWGGLTWNSATLPGTSIAMSVRTGNTPTPDGTWSSFTPVATSGGDIPGTSRYVQYRADLGTGDSMRTPALNEVSIGYNAGADTTPPTITNRSPAPDATDVARDTNVEVQFSEPMNPATINGSNVRLRKQGAGSDVPASVSYSGNTATLNPDADLDPNAVYVVTVSGTVEDANGNPLGTDDTWTFTTGAEVFSFTDTLVSDFSAGDTGADTYVSETANGEVILNPTEGAEFSGGPALPTGWEGGPWTGGASTVSGGSLHVDGAFARTIATYESGRSLEFVANFGGQNNQHVGFAVDLNNEAFWAIFSVRFDGIFNARTNNGGAVQDTPVGAPGQYVGSSHLYRIEWDTTEIRYFVDGALVATHATNFGTIQMRPIASDLTAGGPEIAVDWLRMSPYPASGTFDSRVFDAGPGQSADWGGLSWTADTPVGTNVALSVSTGNTATPDASWSGFTPIAASGGDIPGTSRYVQYRAELSSTDPAKTPTLSEVTVNGTGDNDPTAVDDTKTVAENSDFSSIDVLANDTDPDGGPKSIASATQPAHGTVQVAPDNQSLSYKPNPDYCNTGGPTDDFTYTLNGGSAATVAVTVDCVDDARSADFNGDGFDDLAAGAPLEDIGSASDAGAVNVIYGTASGLADGGNQLWHQDSLGGAESAEADDHFGAALAAGDLNGDGFTDLAIGVPLEDTATSADAGAVTVLYGSASGLTSTGNQLWHQDSSSVAESAETGDRFGAALASADLNGDARDDLVVGVPSESVGTKAGAGAVNAIYGSAAGLSATGNQLWHQNSTGIAESAETGDAFGAAVATGDVNGDGRADLAVGVPSESVGTKAGAGAVNAIYGSAAGLSATANQLWHQSSTGIADATEPGDAFGSAVATGDVNGDGRDDLAVGVPSESVGATTGAGAVNAIYGSAAGLYSTGNQLWHQNSTGILDLAEAGDQFGAALSGLP